jgi:hypothetical protein
MKFCTEVMTLKVMSITAKWLTLTSEVVQIFKRFVDLDNILYGGDDIESDLDAILFNLVASTMP